MALLRENPELYEAAYELERSTLLGRFEAGLYDVFLAHTESVPLLRAVQRADEIRAAIDYAWWETRKTSRRTEDISRRPILAWFDLFSGNGYTRERGLKALYAAAPNPFLLTILLRRLNDWVAQVRAAARKAIPLVLEHTEPETIVSVAWVLLPAASSWGRLDAQDRYVLEAIIEQEAVASGLAKRIETARQGPAARVLRQASVNAALDPFLPMLATSAAQPSVRALACRMLLTGRAYWQTGWTWRWTDKSLGQRMREPLLAFRDLSIAIDRNTLLETAAKDKAVAVRRIVGDVLVERRSNLSAGEWSVAETLLTDPYPSVVERAEFVLRDTSKDAPDT